MDDLMKGLFGIVMVVFLVALAIYLLILAIPFILYGCAVYYGGRKFAQQLGQFELTEKSYLALSGIGAGVLGLTALMVSAKGAHPLFVFLAVPLFLGIAIPTLALWAYWKQRPYLARIEHLQARAWEWQNTIRKVEEQIARLTAQNQAIQARYGERLRLKEEISSVVSGLCQTDAQVWGVRCRKWEGEYAAMSDQALTERLESPGIHLKTMRQTAQEQLGPTIQACLLRLEELRRQIGQPDGTLKANGATLEALEHESQRLQGELAGLQHEQSQADQEHRAFQSSRIRLD